MTDSNRTLIDEFCISFTAARSDLSARLETFKKDPPTGKGALDQIALDIAQLRKQLSDATSFLPSYDQRQYELQVKVLEQILNEFRVSAAPKPKFAFKRKQVTSGSSTPPTSSQHPPAADVAASTSSITSHARSLAGHSNVYLSSSAFPSTTSLSGSEVTISDIDHCIINLLPDAEHVSNEERQKSITALHVRNVKNSILLLPIMSGSAILHDVKNSILVIGCHQFRMHSSSNVDVYLSIPSNPIIEHCTGIRFTGYPESLSRSTGDDKASSKHLSVQDFSHIRATPSPNWSRLSDEALVALEKWPTAPFQGDPTAVVTSLLPQP